MLQELAQLAMKAFAKAVDEGRNTCALCHGSVVTWPVCRQIGSTTGCEAPKRGVCPPSAIADESLHPLPLECQASSVAGDIVPFGAAPNISVATSKESELLEL